MYKKNRECIIKHTIQTVKYSFEIIFDNVEDLLAHGDGCVESEAGVTGA